MKLKILESLIENVNYILEMALKVRVVRTAGSFNEARRTLLERCGIDAVVDGGANKGQWAIRFLRDRPNTRLFSFEPTSSAYSLLVQNSKKFTNWHTFNFALGKIETNSEMLLASNDGQSSSLLEPVEHLKNFPTVNFTNMEIVSVRRLDRLEVLKDATSIYLKLDVQGFEWNAIQGAIGLIEKIQVLEIETTLVSQYNGELAHHEIVPKLIELGFVPFSFGPGARNSVGMQTYVDILLVKADHLY
jgi:FkbM family methyltransferase